MNDDAPLPSCPIPGQHGIAKTMNDGDKIVRVVFVDGFFVICEEIETNKRYKIYMAMFNALPEKK